MRVFSLESETCITIGLYFSTQKKKNKKEKEKKNGKILSCSSNLDSETQEQKKQPHHGGSQLYHHLHHHPVPLCLEQSGRTRKCSPPNCSLLQFTEAEVRAFSWAAWRFSSMNLSTVLWTQKKNSAPCDNKLPDWATHYAQECLFLLWNT